MDMRSSLEKAIATIVKDLSGEDIAIKLDHPEDATHGDFTTTAAFQLAKKLQKPPLQVAEMIREKLLEMHLPGITDVRVAAPGFLNIVLTQDIFITELSRVLSSDEIEKSSSSDTQKIMVEYAHPNTHKEMHIGHMRTLITGEAVARLLEAVGNDVFRANYQGDIGPHVAKALYGIRKLMAEKGLTLEEIESWSNEKKAHFLGEGYALGSQEYEENKDAIDNINMQLYTNSPEIADLYRITRQWSLDYYNEFYSRFYTSFDTLFFESNMVAPGKRIVEKNVGKVFEKANGAVIFPGEKYGLHTRVFITQAGNPTYEGKEMGNAFAEYEAFPFDRKIHIVANEQAGYFKVVFKALELIDPEKFKNKQYHLSMGMVKVLGKAQGKTVSETIREGDTQHIVVRPPILKMSSRTGDVLTVDWLLDQVKEKVELLISEGRIDSDKKAELVEQIIVGAVKYSVLKVGATQDVAFDIERSVSLEGDSGPYLQYSYARTQSVLRKAESTNSKWQMANGKLNEEELQLLRLISRFDEVVVEAAEKLAPNTIATYLYDLASSFNLFYQKHPILKAEGDTREFRLALTQGVGKRLQQGLHLLGIKAPEKM